MVISNCPIVFHDLPEIAAFLWSLSSPVCFMFDGCRVYLRGRCLCFYLVLTEQGLIWRYRDENLNDFFRCRNDVPAVVGEHHGLFPAWMVNG